MKYLYVLFVFLILPYSAYAQVDKSVVKARVIDVITESQEVVPGTQAITVIQTLKAEILQGEEKGRIVTFENDYISLEEKDTFYIGSTFDEDGVPQYRVIERDRVIPLLIFVGIFIGAIVLFGRKQGVRSLLSLAGSMFILAYVLIPSLIGGANPVLMSTFVATLILFIAIFFTHGFKRESVVAFSGTVIAVIATGILSLVALGISKFTGLGTDETVSLSIQSTVPLNFSGLLLGGIMIGVLGVLDDIAVTQVSVVRELYASAPHLTKMEVYKKSLRIGQEHVGALVNTLALAYTGASLPLLLLLPTSKYPLEVLVSQEMFAIEIIRTIVGSIGLVLTVPVTTLLAVYALERYRGKSYEHAHGHSHGHVH